MEICFSSHVAVEKDGPYFELASPLLRNQARPCMIPCNSPAHDGPFFELDLSRLQQTRSPAAQVKITPRPQFGHFLKLNSRMNAPFPEFSRSGENGASQSPLSRSAALQRKNVLRSFRIKVVKMQILSNLFSYRRPDKFVTNAASGKERDPIKRSHKIVNKIEPVHSEECFRLKKGKKEEAKPRESSSFSIYNSLKMILRSKEKTSKYSCKLQDPRGTASTSVVAQSAVQEAIAHCKESFRLCKLSSCYM